MNLRESPAVKNKIRGTIIFTSIWLILCFPFIGLMFVENDKFLVIFGIGFLLIGFYNVYKLLKFYELLKNIEIGKYTVLRGKGYFAIRDSGRYRFYMLEVMVTNSDGTIKKYESDNFRGKLASKVDVFERPVFNRPLVMPFFGSVNEELFYKTLAKDFTVYIDIKNQKNYFVDISPLYIAAEQK